MAKTGAERAKNYRARQKITVTETMFASTEVETVTTGTSPYKCRHPADVPWMEREAMSTNAWRALVDEWNLSEGRVMVNGSYVPVQ